MSVVVRRIAADDWSEWRAIRLRALVESAEAFETRVDEVDDRETVWRARIEAAEACFVARLREVPVGLVAADPIEGDRIELRSMFVADEARRRGVGRALIDAVVDLAAGRPLLLGVVVGNDAAIAAYDRAGFVLDAAASGVACDVIMRFENPAARP